MILIIEAKTDLTRIALAENGSIFTERKINLDGKMSEELLSRIDSLLKTAKVNKKMLKKILVYNGYGSYTGLRISLSSANFLAFSLNIRIRGFKDAEKLSDLMRKKLSVKDKFDRAVLPSYLKPPNISKSRSCWNWL